MLFFVLVIAFEFNFLKLLKDTQDIASIFDNEYAYLASESELTQAEIQQVLYAIPLTEDEAYKVKNNFLFSEEELDDIANRIAIPDDAFDFYVDLDEIIIVVHYSMFVLSAILILRWIYFANHNTAFFCQIF